MAGGPWEHAHSEVLQQLLIATDQLSGPRARPGGLVMVMMVVIVMTVGVMVVMMVLVVMLVLVVMVIVVVVMVTLTRTLMQA